MRIMEAVECAMGTLVNLGAHAFGSFFVMNVVDQTWCTVLVAVYLSTIMVVFPYLTVRVLCLRRSV